MWKKLYNEEEEKKNTVLIDTGLSGNKAKDILNSIIGQMSDGMWENSPAMDHYWPFIEVKMNGDMVFFEVEKSPWNRYTDKNNWFYVNMDLDEKKINEFMANKLKAIAKQELKDEPELGKWDRNNTSETTYLSYSNPITFQEVYFAYEILKGRNCEGKYPPELVREMAC